MAVALYSANWATLGGGEKYVACMAEVLARETGDEVWLVVDHPHVDQTVLERLFGLELARVVFRRCEGNPRSLLARARVAFVSSNVRPLGLPAPRTVYILQIPYGPITARTLVRTLRREGPREALKTCSRLLLLRDARRASMVLVYSEFVRDVLARHHMIHPCVLFPPVDTQCLCSSGTKRPVVLSVGRFFSGPYNEKRHDVLIEAFKLLHDSFLPGSWEYRMVGTCREDGPSQRYLRDLRRRAEGYPVRFLVNVPHAELARHYSEAAFFWHAAGFGSSEEAAPEKMEHFGMSTVEAMGAGCIPLVFGRGGQREIVTHGRSGFLWETPEELVETMRNLVRDEARCEMIRQEARARAGAFSRDRFAATLLSFYERLRRLDTESWTSSQSPPPIDATSQSGLARGGACRHLAPSAKEPP